MLNKCFSWYLFSIWEKTCGLCLSKFGLFHLNWCSLVPLIYLWIKKF
jgi:hypothetical protein